MAYTTIDDPSAYFKVQLFTGTGSENVITFSDTDTDMQPDMVWTKCRSTTLNHNLYDSVRGANKGVKPNTTDAEFDDAQSLKSFNSDGFTVGTDSHINTSSATYVSWNWKESATAGFDITTWAGNETGRTISHNLSAIPHWIIVKVRGTAKQWTCYHKDMTADPDNAGIFLQSTAVPTTGTAGYFGNTAPTSSVFTVGTSTNVNQNSDNVMGYVWTSVQGFSKMGSFEGFSNTDGPFIFTGFTPSMILYKNADYAENWHVQSLAQESINPNNNQITPNENYAESSDANTNIDFLSNGFKMRSSHRTSNYSGDTIIYAAFAKAPLVNSNGVPCNAR
jgi:hypothetical protein